MTRRPCPSTTRPHPPRSRGTRRGAVAAGTLMAGLGAGLTLLSLPSSAPEPAVVAQAQAMPSVVAVPASRTVPARATRSRTLVPPTTTVTKTVATGATFSGEASWYGGSFVGRRTASGEVFDTTDLTAASKTLPFGTRLRVCRGERCVVVRINDRGPYVGDRVLDLSKAAADALGLPGVGYVTATPVARKTVTVVDTAALARMQAAQHRRAVVARRHAVAVQRAQHRTAALQRTELAASSEPWTPAVGAGGLLVLTGGGLVTHQLTRRVRRS